MRLPGQRIPLIRHHAQLRAVRGQRGMQLAQLPLALRRERALGGHLLVRLKHLAALHIALGLWAR